MNILAQHDLPSMSNALLAGIVALAGVVAFLFRTLISRIDREVTRLDANMENLRSDLAVATVERNKSDLKALKAEIASQLPCSSATCPKLASVSLSIGEALRGGTGTL